MLHHTMPSLPHPLGIASITDQSVIKNMSTTPRQRRKETRPQELLDAALALFVEKGFAATRAEEVAARAGVSKGTLYLYFPSKEELLKAVIRHTLSVEIAAGAELAVQHEGSVRTLLVDVLSQWWCGVLGSPASGVIKIVITEVRNFPEIAEFYHAEVVAPGTRIIQQLIQRGIDNGEFRPVDVAQTTFSIILPMVMLCLHKHSLGACLAADQQLVDPPAFIRHHLNLLLDGLRAGPPPSPPAHP